MGFNSGFKGLNHANRRNAAGAHCALHAHTKYGMTLGNATSERRGR